jgi:hypothetical protein
VSDSDGSARPERNPYARPKPGAESTSPTQAARAYRVESSSTFDDPPARRRGASHGAAEPSVTGDGYGSLAAGGAGAVATQTADGDARRPARVHVARRGPRRARLVIKHIDPWTVMKISFVVSVVVLAVIVIAVAIIYAVLGKMGVWDQINNLVNEVSPTTTSAALRNPLSGSRIIGLTAIVGGVNVVLMTALSTLGAAVYNLISDLVGGIEVTLTDP